MQVRYRVMTGLAAGAFAGFAILGATASAEAATSATAAPAAAQAAHNAPHAQHAPEAAQAGKSYKVLATANLRSGPGTKYKKIATLKAKATVTATAKKPVKIKGTPWSWIQVKTANGTVGWVSTGYLKAVK
ncbi:SH3 domain-containing protein [Actinomadura barringtoniae]|uniref:SH3 domain-containing protein n=1 Tax=Actinomadura barringtoniae TaxID=1427535 RepID=A0A939PPL4_9ACTN|nr:SH3 domain-containing protein [Actinomadura barringtoniae]MBO2453809.1 SH3 domain-containing protein [Actinomadura barringtoniae]